MDCFASLAMTSSLLHLARIHLDRWVEQLGGKRRSDLERLLHAEIGLDQLIILLHPLRVDPAQSLRRGEIVGHQEFDALPLAFLIFLIETRDLIEQSLEARRDIGDAGGKRLLAYAHEILGEFWILREESAVDDQRIAVRIEPDILPVDVAEIGAE